jgi:hypothetical protein
LPIAIKLTERQAHDGRSVIDMLDGVQARQILLADRACDSNALRAVMTARRARAKVRPVAHPTQPPIFSAFLDRYGNRVERVFNDAQAFPCHRHKKRETGSELPGPRQTRRYPHLVAA